MPRERILGGLSHKERVFLGLALLHRYRNKRDGTQFEKLFSLLNDDGRKDAEVLGKAMRLGAMLWANPDDETAKLNWLPKKKSLSLTAHSGSIALVWRSGRTQTICLSKSLRRDRLCGYEAHLDCDVRHI